jgi:hypothetical protein
MPVTYALFGSPYRPRWCATVPAAGGRPRNGVFRRWAAFKDGHSLPSRCGDIATWFNTFLRWLLAATRRRAASGGVLRGMGNVTLRLLFGCSASGVSLPFICCVNAQPHWRCVLRLPRLPPLFCGENSAALHLPFWASPGAYGVFFAACDLYCVLTPVTLPTFSTSASILPRSSAVALFCIPSHALKSERRHFWLGVSGNVLSDSFFFLGS